MRRKLIPLLMVYPLKPCTKSQFHVVPMAIRYTHGHGTTLYGVQTATMQLLGGSIDILACMHMHYTPGPIRDELDCIRVSSLDLAISSYHDECPCTR